MSPKAWIYAGFLLLSCLPTACGMRPGAQSAPDGSPPLEGGLMIGTQCPYGMLSDPIPTRPELTGCPMDVRSLKIIGASPLYFMGDCTEKTIAVRTADNLLDTLWQVYPDDRFRVSPGPFWIRLEIPEVGQCWTPATLRLEGSLSCSDQDRMRLEFTRLDADLVSEGVPPQPGITRCPLPPGCRLRSRASLSQCTP